MGQTNFDMPERALKIDLHTHTADDPEEKILHSGRDLIDSAYAHGFDAISITNHNAVSCDGYLQGYARERGILLIPGSELKVEGKHVLVVNPPVEMLAARTFDDLRRLRTPECLIVAPHPYFPGSSSLLSKTVQNIDIFDAIEFSWFYHSFVNFNKFAAKTADRYGIPMIGTSDCHVLEEFGRTYSLVKAERNVESIFAAVRAGRVEIIGSPLRLLELSKHGVVHLAGVGVGILRNLLEGGIQ